MVDVRLFGDDHPDDLIPPEAALESVDIVSDSFDRSRTTDGVVDFYLQSFPGTVVDEKALFRSVHTTSRECRVSAAAENTFSTETIDDGPPPGFTEAEYSGVVEQERVECEACGGFGRTCLECDGTGTVSCPESCNYGTIKYSCGCVSAETNRGRGTSVTAGSGEVLRTCTDCGGKGSQKHYDGSHRCNTCSGQGAFIESCQNCGGDGVSRKEQCSRCDGRGSITCPGCGGRSNVDECPKCEGVGERVVETSEQVEYTLVAERLVDGSDLVQENRKQVSWRERSSDVAEADCDSVLTQISAGSDGNIVRAKRVVYDSVAYEAELTNTDVAVFDASIQDESTRLLVSTDGLVDWEASAGGVAEDEYATGSTAAGHGDGEEDTSSFLRRVDTSASNVARKGARGAAGLLAGLLGGWILLVAVLGMPRDGSVTTAIYWPFVIATTYAFIRY